MLPRVFEQSYDSATRLRVDHGGAKHNEGFAESRCRFGKVSRFMRLGLRDIVVRAGADTFHTKSATGSGHAADILTVVRVRRRW